MMRTTTLPRGEPVRHCHTCHRPLGPGDTAIAEDGDWLTIWCSDECAFEPLQEPKREARPPATFDSGPLRAQGKLFHTDWRPDQPALFGELD